ncbi:nickel ABC transporter permease subunit NikC [Treponema pedis]|uniref:Nickel transporter permease NikC n=4 Tax=Treponema pedis TaxID=409322 RepID=S5ZQT4_9SPIR|nr:nickel ABC transporter permease subunit NikC [Treponema pedis]AGT45022.1 nickel transporter permease NikC [Treponema pedis str. T A4]QOW60290.1 nickel ABC transporter permease subunit NikC [Treponema pedis]QSI05636.1 nickel ABC transporter permease subunit NikC [Treponema pedis]
MKKIGLYVAIFAALIMIFVSVFSYWLVPYDPNEIDLLAKFEPAGKTHLFGTDHLGRDTFSRLLAATSISLNSAFVTLFLILSLGILVGGTAGFAGGKTDQILMRICDIFFSVPTVILALFLVGILGVGLTNVIIAIAVSHWAWYARIVRSIVLSLKNSDYVLITITSGASTFTNFRKNMLKPILSQCAVLATLDIGHIVLHISGLSFLGLGVKAPTAEWGIMISDGKEYIFSHPELIVYPGFAIFLCVMSFNIIGDFLRDKFDVSEAGH